MESQTESGKAEEDLTEISVVEDDVAKAGDKKTVNSVFGGSSKSSDCIPAVTTVETKEAKTGCAVFKAIHDKLRSFLERYLSLLGYSIGLRPWLTALICCLVALSLSSVSPRFANSFLRASLIVLQGCLFVEVETRSDVIWSPDGTLAKENKEYIKRVYPKSASTSLHQESNSSFFAVRSSSIHQFVLTSYPEGKNVLTPEGLRASKKVDSLVKGIQV